MFSKLQGLLLHLQTTATPNDIYMAQVESLHKFLITDSTNLGDKMICDMVQPLDGEKLVGKESQNGSVLECFQLEQRGLNALPLLNASTGAIMADLLLSDLRLISLDSVQCLEFDPFRFLNKMNLGDRVPASISYSKATLKQCFGVAIEAHQCCHLAG